METGRSAGRNCSIRGARGELLFTWRNFAGLADLVSSLASVMIILSGTAATALLIAQSLWGGAAAAFVLSLAFLGLVVLVAPRINVTIYDAEAGVVFTLRQRSKIPGVWLVNSPAGEHLGYVRRSMLRRLIPERWTISNEQEREVALFRNVSAGRALMRKLTLDLAPGLTDDLVFIVGRETSGRIVRTGPGIPHRIEVSRHRIDSRLTLAAAILILTGDL